MLRMIGAIGSICISQNVGTVLWPTPTLCPPFDGSASLNLNQEHVYFTYFILSNLEIQKNMIIIFLFSLHMPFDIF